MGTRESCEIPQPKPVLKRSDCEGSVLTDGGREMRYVEAIELIGAIREEMAEHGLREGDYVDFRCEHGLAGALLWLALLEEGRSFFVHPVAPCYEDPYTPAFCRFSVRMRWSEESGSGFEIDVQEKAGWNGARAGEGGQYVYFRTSGTTGEPKLVAHSGEALRRNATNCGRRLDIRRRDRLVIPVPLYHMYGLGAAFLPGALAGASMDFQSGSNLLRFLEGEKRFRPNIAFLTPTFMETLAKGRRSGRAYDLTVVAGDILRRDLFESYEERFGMVVSLYGSTELGAVLAAGRDDRVEVRGSTVGRVMEGVECDLEEGPRGQLLCRCAHGFAGYAGDDGRVAQGDASEWYATRDLAEWGEGGSLRILGRMDQSVNRDGVLIALGEVERALEGIPGVTSAKAVAAGESPRGQGIVAFCVVEKGASMDGAGVRAACFGAMRRGSIPDRVVIVEGFPLLPSGKPDRVALAALATGGIESGRAG